jgi:uncharacterized protein
MYFIQYNCLVMFSNKSSQIKLIPVDLESRIKIPVSEIYGNNSGPSMVITSGADGDEYASIEASFRLIEEFKNGNFSGKLTIIPILNIPGFNKIISRNPKDGKYPKHIYPGKENGTSSERLMFWLHNNFLKGSDLWLDMHGGAINEMLDPFIYFYETENIFLNNKVEKIIKMIDSDKIVYEKPGSWDKVVKLSKNKIIYVLSESGFSGSRNDEYINKHINWAKTIMSVLGMINIKHSFINKPRIYRNTYDYKSNYSGLWYPKVKQNSFIKKNSLIGKVCSMDGNVMQEIVSKHEGEYLWGLEGLFVEKNDTLVEIGF